MAFEEEEAFEHIAGGCSSSSTDTGAGWIRFIRFRSGLLELVSTPPGRSLNEEMNACGPC